MTMQPPTSPRTTIGVLGGKGMLGSDLVEFLSTRFDTIPIDRDNYEDSRSQVYDVLINANGNSRRFWANQNPVEDFEMSTLSVYKSIFDFDFKKYIYISSSDVYPDHSSPSVTSESAEIGHAELSPYGFHKYLSECVLKNRVEDYLILRCSMILGTSLRKGPLYDILANKPLYITLESRLQMITTHEIAAIIEALLEKNLSRETFNIGGKGVFEMSKISSYIKMPISVGEEAETQVYEMNVAKLDMLHSVKTSKEYLEDFIAHHGKEIQ